jgi:phospholipase/carboxylesterase
MRFSRPAGTARHVVSRRRFVESGLAALTAPLVARCADFSTGTRPNPRLSARPGTPTVTPTLGLSELGIGIGTSRDGLLYVPTTYTGETPLPLFVALHGAGGSAASWASYQARAEARGMVLLAPESRGATWDLVLGGLGPDVAFLTAALRHAFDRCRIAPARIALGGFSDGASYALSLGVSNGDLFTHLVGHSPGFLDATAPIVGRPRIYGSHGIYDAVLPVSATRDVIVPTLRAGGYDVTYQEFYGFHEIPAKISDAALDWFLAGI